MEYRSNFNSKHEDLTRIFDKKYQANYNTNKEVQQKRKDFNEKFFGIKDKEDVRGDVLESHSVGGQVNNLKQRMDGMKNNRFNNKI